MDHDHDPDPVPRSRMLAPDLARGVMLLLIALAHAPLLLTGSSLPTLDERLRPSTDPADQVTNAFLTVVVFSRSFPLFAALLGYGLVLVVRGRRRRGESDGEIRRRVRRRGRWMLVLGLVMALLVTPVEILGAYGLLTVLLAGVVVGEDRRLRRAILVLAGVAVAASVVLGLTLSGSPGEQGPPSAALGHLGYAPADLVYRLVSWFFSLVVNVTLFPIALAVLVGVWAGRRRLLEEPDRHRGLLRRTVVVGLVVSVCGATPLVLTGAGLLGAEHTWWAQAVHVLTGLAGGFGYAAIFGLIGRRVRTTARWTRPLTAVGQRSLTCYVTMEAALILLSSTAFLGLGARVGPAGSVLIGVTAWLVALAVAQLLRVTDRGGPAEWLLRRLVDGRAGGGSPRAEEQPVHR